MRGDFQAQPGEGILPAFRAAQSAAQALQPRAGTGSYLAQTPLGFAISGSSRGRSYNHPWKPSLVPGGGASQISLARGLVDTFTPTIRVGKTGPSVPMTGLPGMARPMLKLLEADTAAAEDGSESWVCVEVHPGEDGRLTKESLIEIVHRDAPLSFDPAVGRCPLVHVLWRGGRAMQAMAIAMFNLRYYRTSPAEGQGVAQHFFF